MTLVDTHGYWWNDQDGQCYGDYLDQYELTRDLETLEPLNQPIEDDMSHFHWVDDPSWKRPSVLFNPEDNLNAAEFALLKDELRSSPIFRRMLVDRYNKMGWQVDLIYITGSRLSGICDARSDIDIIIITKEDNQQEKFNDYDLLLVWKNKPEINMHWYIRDWKDIVTNSRSYFINNTTGTYWNIFPEQLQKNILYANLQAQETIDKYINNSSPQLRDQIIYGQIETVKNSLYKFINLNCIPEENYSKIWYHVCIYSLALQGKKPIDYKSQLLRLKRMRWNGGLTAEDNKWAIEQIKWIVNWYDNFEDKWKKQAN